MTAAAISERDLPPPTSGSILEGFRSTLEMRADTLACTRRMYERDGAAVEQRYGPYRAVNLFGPDAAKLVLLNRDSIFSNKLAWDLIIGKLFTNGLMLRDGEDHRHQRRIMHSAFKTPALEDYLDRMNLRIEERLAQWNTDDPFLAYP